VASAALVSFGIGGYYWEGTGDESVLIMMIAIVQLPILFLYWAIRLMWRDALLVMSNGDFTALASGGQSQKKLLRMKFFLLAILIGAQMLTAPVLYLLINRGHSGILAVVLAQAIGGLLTVLVYVFDFFWVNKIKSVVKDVFVGIFILGLFFIFFEGSIILLDILGVSAVIFIILTFMIVWKKYS
jgi:hypothetical protein